MTTWKTISGGQYADVTAVETVANLLVYSEQFDNAAWFKSVGGAHEVSVSANATTAPDGTLTADKLIGAAGAAAPFIAQTLAFTATSYAFTFYAKAGEASSPKGSMGAEFGNPIITFNLLTGVASAVSGTYDSIGMDYVGDGLYRCYIVATATSAASRQFQIRLGQAGDGISGVYIWGAQVKKGTTPGPYVKTTTAARTADVLTLSTDLSWEDSGEYSHFIKYLQDDGTLSANVEVTWAGSNKVAADMTFTSTPQYLFFGWGETEIKQWTDWEII